MVARSPKLPLCFVAFSLLILCALLARPAFGQGVPHDRFDAVLESGLVGSPVGSASDTEFLRRVYLDLTGRIPTAEQARQFLADSAPDKRARVIDQLLDSPQFVRHMAVSLDIMLMERRQEKYVPALEWRQYLYDSISATKPLKEIYREILMADGADPAQRPAAKFVLEREVEPNLLTRDVGRMVFGVDMQCAQCHDHPLINDYEQREYYGLFAFFQRSSLFLDTKDNNKAYVAEIAEGDANFKSVFTQEEGKTMPCLPGGGEIEDLIVAKEDIYVVKPDKEIRPVPKYSRRKRLADEVARGDNRAFERNLANRLWAHMMGRGLVDPVDLHHDDNPPAHPALLDLLADELVAMRFDLRTFLREVALTRAYQRSVYLPSDWRAEVASAAAQIPALESDLAARAVERDAAVKLAAEQRDLAAAKVTELAAERTALREKEIAAVEAEKLYRDANSLFAGTQQQIESKRSVSQSLSDALVAARRAAELLPAETSLADVLAKLQAQSDKVQSELNAAEAALPTQQQAAAAANDSLTAAQQALQSTQSNWQQLSAPLREMELQAVQAAEQLRQVHNRWVLAKRRLDDARKLASLQSALDGDVTARDEAHAAIEQIWIRQAAAAPLKPLTPEQLCWSMLQATGLLERQQIASETELKQKPDAPTDPKQFAAAVEKDVFTKLEGNIGEFVRLFGAGAGQPQHVFFATVDQALFFSNGGYLSSWIVPSAGNLTDRLSNMQDPAAIADELYMSVLTRAPTVEEAALIRQAIEAQPQDKSALIQEFTWALLTSAEFRFSP